MTTINGKSIQEMERALASPFTGLASRKNNNDDYAYIDVRYYKERLDEVIGVFHYSEIYSDLVHIHSDLTGQELFSCSCSLTIYDDNGVAVIKKQAFGGVELQPESNSGKVKAINNELIIANRIAFRNTCSLLNLFANGGVEKALQEGRVEKSKGKNKPKTYENKPIENKPVENTADVLSGKFISTAIPTISKNKGIDFHKVLVKHIVNDVPGSTVYELNIFQNNLNPELQSFINTSAGNKASIISIRKAKVSMRDGQEYPQLNISMF